MDPLPKKPKAEMFHPPLPSPQPKLLPSMPLSNINTSNTISTPTRPTPKRTKVNKKKTCRRWTAEEDERLRKAVEKYGPRKWRIIAKEVGGYFTADQCNQHWHRVLNPAIVKGNWTKEEIDLLFQRVALYGESAWTKVAEGFKGRTDIQCRHRYFTEKKERMMKNKPLYGSGIKRESTTIHSNILPNNSTDETQKVELAEFLANLSQMDSEKDQKKEEIFAQPEEPPQELDNTVKKRAFKEIEFPSKNTLETPLKKIKIESNMVTYRIQRDPSNIPINGVPDLENTILTTPSNFTISDLEVILTNRMGITGKRLDIMLNNAILDQKISIDDILNTFKIEPNDLLLTYKVKM